MSLLDELDAADCWCGKTLAECEDLGGCRWTRALAAAVAAERERLTAVISPLQFRKLADWFDADDEFKEAMFPGTWSPGTRKDEVQQDLRRFADLLEEQP